MWPSAAAELLSTRPEAAGSFHRGLNMEDDTKGANNSDADYQVNTPSSCKSEEQMNLDDDLESIDWGISNVSEHKFQVENNNVHAEKIQIKIEEEEVKVPNMPLCSPNSNNVKIISKNKINFLNKVLSDGCDEAALICKETIDLVAFCCEHDIGEQIEDMLLPVVSSASASSSDQIQSVNSSKCELFSEIKIEVPDVRLHDSLKQKQKVIEIDLEEEPVEPNAIIVKAEHPETMRNTLNQIRNGQWSQDEKVFGVHKFLLDLGKDIVMDSVSSKIGLAQAKQMRKLMQKQKLNNADEQKKANCKKILSEVEHLRKQISRRCSFLEEKKWHRCRHCAFKSDLENVVKYHENDPHQNEKKRYFCTYCIDENVAPIFKSGSATSVANHAMSKHRIHMNPYSTVTKQSCPSCPYDSSHIINFARHVANCRQKFKPATNLAPPAGFTPALAIPVKPATAQKVTPNVKVEDATEETEDSRKNNCEEQNQKEDELSEDALFKRIEKVLDILTDKPPPSPPKIQQQVNHPNISANLVVLNQAISRAQLRPNFQRFASSPRIAQMVSPAGFMMISMPSVATVLKPVASGTKPTRYLTTTNSGRIVPITKPERGRPSGLMSRVAVVTNAAAASQRQTAALLSTDGELRIRSVTSSVTSQMNNIENRKRSLANLMTSAGGASLAPPNKRMSLQPVISCEICQCRLATLEAYSKHLATSHKIWLTASQLGGRAPLLCRLCPVRFHTGPALQRHLSIAHSIPQPKRAHSIPQPKGVNVLTPTTAAIPVMRQRPQRPILAPRAQPPPPNKSLVYKCSLCTDSFPSESAVVTHLKFFHKINPKDPQNNLLQTAAVNSRGPGPIKPMHRLNHTVTSSRGIAPKNIGFMNVQLAASNQPKATSVNNPRPSNSSPSRSSLGARSTRAGPATLPNGR